MASSCRNSSLLASPPTKLHIGPWFDGTMLTTSSLYESASHTCGCKQHTTLAATSIILVRDKLLRKLCALAVIMCTIIMCTRVTNQ
jgi:hypothetical protein